MDTADGFSPADAGGPVSQSPVVRDRDRRVVRELLVLVDRAGPGARGQTGSGKVVDTRTKNPPLNLLAWGAEIDPLPPVATATSVTAVQQEQALANVRYRGAQIAS